MSTEIFVERMNEDAVLPSYAHDGDAGMDLYSTEDVLLAPGETKLIHTGLKFAIPVGYEVQIRPASYSECTGYDRQRLQRRDLYHSGKHFLREIC